MPNRWPWAVVTLSTFALLVAGCSSSVPGDIAAAPRDVTSIPGYVAPTPQLALNPGAPCPRSLGPARDVANHGPGLSRRLVPPAVPGAGLVCVYRPPDTIQTAHDAPRLVQQVRLSAIQATVMTHDLALVSLAPLRATYSCPGGPGRIIIVGFSYAHRPPVSLWYADRGCPTLDNGHVVANGVDQPSFYDHFAKRVEALLR